MIVYDLVCTAAHRFEAWFGSSGDYDDQQQRGLLKCPVCGSAQVAKAVMAPAVPAKSNRKGDTQSLANDDPMARLLMLQRAFEASSDYVGDRFAAEARAILSDDLLPLLVDLPSHLPRFDALRAKLPPP